jgi:16S rRNA (adenine1518-N6/adenine1519-N6)-dimethyltransferase
MRQRYGQNFLIDNNVANKIIKSADLNENDNVLEIGPGKGILTKIISPLVNNLTAIEIDKKLCEYLRSYFLTKNFKNVNIINFDFLNYALPINVCKIISNLPYNIGTSIIQKILPLKNWTIAVVMLQKEISQKMVAKPGDKNYGYISIFASYYSDCNVLFDVSPKSFYPIPSVNSSVIKFTNKFKQKDDLDILFFKIVKHVFNIRRKTILNSISLFEKKLKKELILQIFKRLQIDPSFRPNKLTFFDFLRLTDEIKKYIIRDKL